MLESTTDTIIALATANGIGAIGVIRLSGPKAITTTDALFPAKDLTTQPSHTIHFGTIRDEGEIVDEVLVSLFKAPNSYTREDVVEISCHGSPYIIKRIIELFIRNGVRLAKAGEFTQRAFFNGQLDLAQAEAVADLIASDSEASHKAAINQMRGGFSQKIKELRGQLIHFASMIELELDFGEEDVEFADRSDLRQLIESLLQVIKGLKDSFQLGNVVKNGVPTVIAGKPNAGKSTLLNTLLNEERAIVSDIAGTTRDVIEDEMIIEGISFRFIDTAGLRDTSDKIEAIGVEKTRSKMKEASLILYLFDLSTETVIEVQSEINMLENLGIPFIIVGNKMDKAQSKLLEIVDQDPRSVIISAISKENVEALKQKVLEVTQLDSFNAGDTIVTNARHFESLLQTQNSLEDVINGLNNKVTGDFLAMDIRQSLHYLGEITGEITTDDLLGNIFSKFCIGK